MSTVIGAGYGALMAVLFGVYVRTPPEHTTVVLAAIGLLSAGAVLFGSARHAPIRRTSWWLLAAVIFAMTAGDVLFVAHVQHPAAIPMMLPDLCYFAMFPLIIAAFVGLTSASHVLRDRSRLLNLLTFTCAAGLMSWVFLIAPSLTAEHLSTTDRSVRAAYVLGDLLILIASLQLVIVARRSWAVLLLATGSAGLLTANIAYALAQLGNEAKPDNPAALGYLVLYIAWGAAALHPSMAQLTAPVDASPPRTSSSWTMRLRVSLAVPPATMLLQAATGRVRDSIVIAVTSLVMSELVIIQLTDMVSKHRRALARERGLRQACAALVAATDNDEVSAAVQAAIDGIMPQGGTHRITLWVADTNPAQASTAGGADPTPHHRSLVPAPSADRGTRMVRTRLLHPVLRDELGHFETAMVCPLLLDRRSPLSFGVGTLVVAAPERVLDSVRDTIEVLVAQAALAFERIALNDVVNRRDGDQYLRAVVRSTADLVLIVDDDNRIRYASPSLTTILGIAPAADATLRDIVHPDDHDKAERTRASAEHDTGPDGALDIWTLRRPDGSRVLVEVNYRDLRADRMIRGFVITMRDTTGLQAGEHEQIRRMLRGTGGWQNRRSSQNRFR